MHIPVMLEETLLDLAPGPGGVFADGTLGSAGHSRAILEKCGSGGTLIGIDRDMEAIERSRAALADVPGRKILVHGRHGDIARIVRENGFTQIDGVLIDCGVSSDQLDTAERGFAFSKDGPLDMRMDPSAGESAADFIANRSEEEIARVLHEFGEEPFARRIARAICEERRRGRIETTGALAATVEKAAGRHGAKHPATRTFQALRMAVNGEIDELVSALRGGLEILKPGGRFAVITFESLCDRTVKRFFAAHTVRERSLPQGGSVKEFEKPAVRLLRSKALAPSAEESAANPRARSAKLRTAEKIDFEV